MRYVAVLLLLVGCGGGTFSEPDSGVSVVSDAGTNTGQCFRECSLVSCGSVDPNCGAACAVGSGCVFEGCAVDCTATAIAQCTDPAKPNVPPAANCVTGALIDCTVKQSNCCTAHRAAFPLDQCL